MFSHRRKVQLEASVFGVDLGIPTQVELRWAACGHRADAGVVAAMNIPSAAARLLGHGPPDTAR